MVLLIYSVSLHNNYGMIHYRLTGPPNVFRVAVEAAIRKYPNFENFRDTSMKI